MLYKLCGGNCRKLIKINKKIETFVEKSQQKNKRIQSNNKNLFFQCIFSFVWFIFNMMSQVHLNSYLLQLYPTCNKMHCKHHHIFCTFPPFAQKSFFFSSPIYIMHEKELYRRTKRIFIYKNVIYCKKYIIMFGPRRKESFHFYKQ